MFPLWAHWSYQSGLHSQDSYQWRPPKSAPVEEDPETSLNVPLGTIYLGSFEVLSDHGDAEGDGDVDEFLKEYHMNCVTVATCLLVQEYRDFRS